MQNDSKALPGFSYSRAFFEELVDTALAHAKKLGATDAGAEASEGSGLSVSVRKGELETVERNRDKSLGVTVYLGQRRGNASTSDFSRAAIEQTVQAAYDIARFTAEDPVAGLPDEADVATEQRDLDLFHPWPITSEQAAELALACEHAALAVDKRITNSEGAGVSAQQSHFFSAHTHGFRGGYASSRHSLSVAPIAGKGNDMQRDYWYSSERNARDLAAPEAVGRYAASRFAHQAAPALTRFANSSPSGFINGIKAARQQIVARTDEDRETFLRKRGFSKLEAGKIIDKVLVEEGHPAESIFDFVQGITRLARDKTQQDTRLELEGKAKKLLERAG